MYRISRDGKTKTNITPGSYDVVKIVRIDAEGGYVYFMASPDDPQRRYLYRVALDGSSATPEKLSPVDQIGTHNYIVSHNGKNAIHSVSSRNTPEVTDLVSLPDHKSIKILNDNADLKAKFDAITKGDLEFFQLTTEDDVTLEGLMRFPVNFDPSKKYPVIFFVYGEPAGMTGADRWNGSEPWNIMMTQKGYIFVTLDSRGQPAPKGRAWRKSIYRTLGITNTRDQAMGLKALLADRSYMDGDRIGVWGHSGGGTTTLNLLFRYPDMYHVGVSRAPVPDLTLYDNIYQERYSGVLPDDAESYKAASAITHAAGLKGKLLLMHGTGDDNVHYQGSERLINKLVELNKPFDFMSYPNRTHGIREGKNTQQHLNTKQMQYFLDHLPAGPR
jgi:dipeptidyl-peptidase-4